VTILDLFFWLFHDGAFWVFAVTAVAGALMVVISQNVVRMAFWLIISLGATAGLFFSLNADFVGSAQLLIYVGGTLVLLIFGVMLTASAPFLKMKTSPG
jgi:NADH-quinone oxidoreductase subunit J